MRSFAQPAPERFCRGLRMTAMLAMTLAVVACGGGPDPADGVLVFNAQLAEPGQADPNDPNNKKVQRMSYCGTDGQDCLDAAKTPWADIQRAAEAYYDRSDECRFTTMLGYEWTGSPQ